MTGGFDLGTGVLTTEAGESIGPDLARPEFLGSTLASDATTLIENEPWHSWLASRAIGGRPFRVALYFDGERLDMVMLALDEPAFGRSWADWTRENELARKAAHDAWLATGDPTIGDANEQPWGFVTSILDEKSGGSEIVIRYGARLPEQLPTSPLTGSAPPGS